MLKIIKHYILIAVVILGLVLFAVIVKAVSDSYRVNKTASSIINEHGSCRVVNNTSGVYDFFIPTKTSNEWNLFKTNKPASVSLGSCYQCPTTGSIYDNQTTCNSACIQTANCGVNLNNITFSGSSPDCGNYTQNIIALNAYGSYINVPHNNCGNIGPIYVSNGSVSGNVGAGATSAVGSGSQLIFSGNVCAQWSPCTECAGGYYCSYWTTGEVGRLTFSSETGITVSGTATGNSTYGFKHLVTGGNAWTFYVADGGNTVAGTITFSGGNYSYSCPLGGYACTGSPPTCTAGQACTTLP